MVVRRVLEKAWFSLFLFACICVGVFRVFEDPQKKFARQNGMYASTEASYLKVQDSNHVTKPMNLARNGTGFSDHVLFFNRVPKSGSEMLVLLLQWLQGSNGFRHIRLSGGEKRKLSALEQVRLNKINKELEEV